MKKLDTSFYFLRKKWDLLTVVLLLLNTVALLAQPTVFYTNATPGTATPATNSRFLLTDKGAFRQAIFQTTTTDQLSKQWAFSVGTQASPNYSPCWRPYASGSTAIGVNAILVPNQATPAGIGAGALYNSTGGGADGNLPTFTANQYYIINVEEQATANNLMNIISTGSTTAPSTQGTPTHTAGTTTVTFTSTFASYETVFVRASADNFVTSTVNAVTMSGANGTFTLPSVSSTGNPVTVSYYFFTSNRTVAQLSSATVNNVGQRAYDLWAINVMTNNGTNYSTSVTQTVTIGSTYYANLGAAFTTINSGTHTGAIAVSIIGNPLETGTAILNASGSGSASYTSVSITPSGGAMRTVSGTISAGPIIDLVGADNVTINGLNTGGNGLTISNTSNSALGQTSTIRFAGGATNNLLTNCSILGSFSGNTSLNGGTIFFSTDATTSNGNDNNTVSNCNIGAAGANFPTRAIHCNGSTTTTDIFNNNLTFSNNNIFDYFNTSSGHAGINVGGGNTDITISGNKFYQTTTRNQMAAGNIAHTAISINNSTGNNFQVLNNIIGYAAADGTGIYTLEGKNLFTGISLNVGTTTASSIQGNTIAAINQTNTVGGTIGSSTSPFLGITVSGGLVNIGTTTGNTIGSPSTTGNITVNCSAALSTDMAGILGAGATSILTISNNTFGGFTASNPSTTTAFNLYGIRMTTSPSVVTINNNTIGGWVANSIQNNGASVASQIFGIATAAPATTGTTLTVTSNTIRNMTGMNGTGTGTAVSVIGILINAPTLSHTVSRNKIYGLSNTSTNAAVSVHGMTLGTLVGSEVSKNDIHSLNVAGEGIIRGIFLINAAGTGVNLSNNMIRLGIDVGGNSISVGADIMGVQENSGINNLYYNTMYIGGTNVTGTKATYAFNNSQTGTRTYNNNLFINTRSNGSGTGKHYAIRYAVNTTLTANYNNFIASGTGGTFGNYDSGVDQTTLAAWKTATGKDANSLNETPVFIAATGDTATVNLHLNKTGINNCTLKGEGTPISITDDFDNDSRHATKPGIGADEYGGDKTPSVIIAPSPSATVCVGTNVTFTATPTNGGTATYQWKKDGTNATTGITYAASDFATGNSITCVMTVGSDVCAAAPTATSAATVMTVHPKPTVTLLKVDDNCQVNAGSIMVTITGGAPNYSVAACGTTIAPSPTVGTYIPVTGSPATVTTSGGSTTFSSLQGNATYKLTVTDTNGCIGQE